MTPEFLERQLQHVLGTNKQAGWVDHPLNLNCDDDAKIVRHFNLDQLTFVRNPPCFSFAQLLMFASMYSPELACICFYLYVISREPFALTVVTLLKT